MTDPSTLQLVHSIAGMADIAVEHDHYASAGGPLGFDLYRPRTAAPAGAVIFVFGYADADSARGFKDWASYQGWARLLAASGLVAIVARNRDPLDPVALVEHVRGHAAALGIDPARIGIWACSGHVPAALAVIARAHPACAALLYGYLLDLDGATAVADAAKLFRFATPAVALDELSAPMLVVRAGLDAMPGLEPTLQRFVAAARARGLPVTLIDNAEAPHAFDLVDDSPRTHVVIEEVIAYLTRALAVASP